MSHATGMVRFPDDHVFYYEYNGTSDCVCTALFQTANELSAAWRTDSAFADCQCGREPDAVDVMTFYGDGSSWRGMACKGCKAIISPTSWDDWCEKAVNGIPDWTNAQAPAPVEGSDLLKGGQA